MKKPIRKLVIRSEAIRILRTLDRLELEPVQGRGGFVAADGGSGGGCPAQDLLAFK